jgi:hypothetical protein
MPGLSFSGMKDFAVSPLRYWYRNINPNRPPFEATPEMQLGSALHCAVSISLWLIASRLRLSLGG